jgi:hypothetical protein
LPQSPKASKYFAAATPDEIGNALFRKVSESGTWAETSEIIRRSERAYLYYFGMEYGGAHATSQVLRGGEQGELADVRVNHSRALAQTLFNLIAASKVVWQPVATNKDYSAESQAVLATNILEYYWHVRRVAQYAQRSLEEAIPFCESFVLTEWDETLGDDQGVDALGNIVKSGDIRFSNVMTWDVLRDPRKRSFEELNWVIVRLRRNRFDVAAQVRARLAEAATEEEAEAIERLAEEVENVQPMENAARRMRMVANGGVPDEAEYDDEDLDLYLFLHKPTPMVPEGRETYFVSAKGVIKDGPLTYTQWPLHRVHHSELFGTPFAYSPYLEILGIQELMDSLETAIASNQSTFATQLILLPRGSGFEPDQLGKGLSAVYYDDKEPKALQLTRSPQEVFAHLETKKKDIEQLMGLNSVVRGEPLTGDQSGAALALLQAQAVQQSSGLQANYLRFVESIGNSVLELIRNRCPTPRRIAITGKATSFLQKEQEFTGDSIGQIKQVRVETGNPLSQTAAGRAAIARELLQNQLVQTAEQYIQVLTTGRLEPLTQSVQNQLLLISRENEMLLRGEAPILTVDDHDVLHAREHASVMANPDARQDPAILAAYQEHMQAHFQQWMTKDPAWSAMLGQTPPPMPAPMPGGVGPGAPPSGGPPGPQPGVGEQANLPSMPVNPATGEQAGTPDGATLAKPGLPPGPK